MLRGGFKTHSDLFEKKNLFIGAQLELFHTHLLELSLSAILLNEEKRSPQISRQVFNNPVDSDIHLKHRQIRDFQRTSSNSFFSRALSDDCHLFSKVESHFPELFHPLGWRALRQTLTDTCGAFFLLNENGGGGGDDGGGDDESTGVC